MKITGRLENWEYDLIFNCVWGNVFEDIHGRFVNNTWIHTSSLKNSRQKIEKTPLQEGDRIETLNSIYLLGKPREKNNV